MSDRFDLVHALITTASVAVVGKHNGKGRPDECSGLTFEPSELSTAQLVDAAQAAYHMGAIDERGRFWFLADGPIKGTVATVLVAGGEIAEDALERVRPVLAEYLSLEPEKE